MIIIPKTWRIFTNFLCFKHRTIQSCIFTNLSIFIPFALLFITKNSPQTCFSIFIFSTSVFFNFTLWLLTFLINTLISIIIISISFAWKIIFIFYTLDFFRILITNLSINTFGSISTDCAFIIGYIWTTIMSRFIQICTYISIYT